MGNCYNLHMLHGSAIIFVADIFTLLLNCSRKLEQLDYIGLSESTIHEYSGKVNRQETEWIWRQRLDSGETGIHHGVRLPERTTESEARMRTFGSTLADLVACF